MVFFITAGKHHRLIKKTDRTLDVAFSRFEWNSFTITLRQNPRGVSRSRRRITTQRKPVLRRLRENPLGCCLWVIVNVFHPNLEKTTFSVISINLWQASLMKFWFVSKLKFFLAHTVYLNSEIKLNPWTCIWSKLI